MQMEKFFGTNVCFVPDEGPLLSKEEDATVLLGETYGLEADWIAIPILRLHADMLDLKTRQLGLFLQKFMNYRLNVAIVGDVTAGVERSVAFADFVRESNRGRHVCFVMDRDALKAHLSTRA